MNDVKKSVGYGMRGWILIIASIFTNFMLAAATGDSLNILAPTFEESFGWNQSSIYLLASFGMWIAAAVSVLFSYLLKRWKDSAKKISIITLAVTTVSIVLWGYCTQFWQFAVLFFIVDVCVNLAAYYGSNTLISNWFPKKKGSAIGIATTGMNAASFAIVWIIMLGWNLLGWHGGFYIFAFLAFIPLMLIIFCVKEYPERCGCFPDNDKTMSREEAQALMALEEKYDKTSYFTVKNSLKNKEMWKIAVGCGLTMMATCIVYQFIACFTARGYSETEAAIYLTITGIVAIPCSILLGIFDQKKGSKKACLVVAAMCAMGMICLAIPVGWLIYPGILGVAFCLGTTNNVLMSMTATVFGRYDYKSVYAVIAPIYIFITGCGSFLISKLCEVSGSYALPCYIMAGLCIIAFIIFLTVNDKLIGRTDEDIKKMFDEEKAAAEVKSAK